MTNPYHDGNERMLYNAASFSMQYFLLPMEKYDRADYEFAGDFDEACSGNQTKRNGNHWREAQMEYRRKAALKVECIASKEDFDFFGIALEDVLDRTEAGMYFLKKAKELCAMTQKVAWTNVAYTLNITMLADGRVSFEFSECIEDYIVSLRHSLVMADEETRGPLEEFIQALEDADEDEARKLVSHFERNIKDERSR